MASAFGRTRGYPRLFGIGVEPSFADAAVYLKRAALGGSVGAQFVLGVFLAHGKLFEPNLRRAQIWLKAAERNGHKRATKELEKITNVLLRKEDEEKERALRDEIESARGASPTLDRLDIVPMRLSDREAQVCHELGLKRGRECAIQGLARYKRILVSKSMLVNDLSHLEALHELSVNTALRRGLLNPDSLDGIEEICDGTEANVTAWKAAFIDGVEAGIKVGVYGESYEE